MPQRTRQTGQALGEYGLSITLIVFMALGGLVLLGDQISDIFSGLLSSPKVAQVAAVKTTGAGGTGVNSLSNPPVTGHLSANGIINLSVTLSSGQRVQMNAYPADLAKSVATAGANGTTSMLLGDLDAVIKGLQDQGNMPPAQSDILMKLSNQGHKIAGIEKIIEDTVAQYPPGSNPDLVYDNQTISLQILSSQIGWSKDSNDQPAMATMRSYLNEAISSGALSDASAKQVVSTLVDQIANIANGVETASYYFMHQNEPADQFTNSVMASMNERDLALGLNTQGTLLDLGPSVITHQGSAKICAVGTGGDTGTACQ